jgi:inosine/xanthosine triphosphate pyrophosphatase family protein
MKKKILIASNNPSKVQVYQENLSEYFDLVFLRDLRVVVDFPPENEPTVEGNAILKAKTAYEATGVPSLGDDAGVAIDALDGAPGVMARRWGGLLPDSVSDEDWIDFLWRRLRMSLINCVLGSSRWHERTMMVSRWCSILRFRLLMIMRFVDRIWNAGH